MKIYLVRHGEPVSPDIDPKRPLSPDGRSRVEAIARRLGERSFPLAVIYHSTRKRASETAEIMQKYIAPSTPLSEIEGIGPNDPIEPFFTRVLANEEDCMIVGHQPFLQKFLGKLVEGDEDVEVVRFGEGMTVCIGSDDGKWTVKDQIGHG